MDAAFSKKEKHSFMICLTEIKPTEWNGMPEFHIFREWEYS